MNTITLSRADWHIVEWALTRFVVEHNLGGGSVDCIIENINDQLDKQEY